MAAPDNKTLDFSTGDPLRPLTAIANHAFHQSLKDLPVYHVTGQAGLGQPVGEILRNISDYFTKRGYYPDGWTGLGTRGLLMTGGGTTEAYELVIRAIAEDVRRREKDTGCSLKPVIVMPVPTYGYFLRNPENWGIEVVKIERDWRSSGELDARKLHDLLLQLEQDGKRAVAYYDCNPHNPLGTLRTRRETENVARVIAWHNRRYEEKDIAWQRDTGKKGYWRWDGIGSRINIIDDLIYSGLEYGDEEPRGFAQLEREENHRGIFKHTFSLLGPSKAGLVNIRAGLVIAESDHINTLRDIQTTTSYFPPKITMHALEAFYSDQPVFARKRKAHLQKMNEEHRFAGVLMKTLVNGLDRTELDGADRARIDALVPVQQLRRRAIPGVRIITDPQAGFFHLLDFSGLKGKIFSNENVPNKHFAGTTAFSDEYGINHLGNAYGLKFAYGSWAGLEKEDCVVRVSFAKPIEDIVEFCARLNRMARECHPAAKKDSVNSMQPA